MKRVLGISFVVLAVVAVIACTQPAPKEEAAPAAATEQAAPETAPAAPATVEVAAEGTTFDPPVPVSELPDGAWYCDMGEGAHYAQMSPGKCPTCGTDLVEKVAAAAPPAEEPAAADTEKAPADQG